MLVLIFYYFTPEYRNRKLLKIKKAKLPKP